MKHLLEFNEYDKQDRSFGLTESKFREILKNNCKNWLNNPLQLVRFKNKPWDKFAQINPSEYIRKSLNHENYNVVLMDNLPSWSKFPKRSKSVIFYNRNYYTDIYGNHLYFVIPFDNAKFGKAPADDLWESINRNNRKIALDSIFSRGMFNINAPIEYNKFVKYMNTEFIKKDFFDDKYTYTEFLEIRQDYYDSSDKYENFMEFFNEYMSPSNFKDIDNRSDSIGYKVVDYNNLPGYSLENAKECWTDSNCLIYYAGEVGDSYSVSKKFHDFIEMLDI